jgi:hypothetical protein
VVTAVDSRSSLPVSASLEADELCAWLMVVNSWSWGMSDLTMGEGGGVLGRVVEPDVSPTYRMRIKCRWNLPL